MNIIEEYLKNVARTGVVETETVWCQTQEREVYFSGEVSGP